MTTSTAGALTQTTAGTLAPSAAVPPPPMIHKEGYFTAAYVLVFGGLLLYVAFLLGRFPARRGGVNTPHS